MFQFALPAVLFRFKARGPSRVPLLQLPNRRATAQGDADSRPCYVFIFLNFMGELCLRTPPYPLTGYADRWQKKDGGADAPVRITRSRVQIQGARPTKGAVAATAKPKGNSRYFHILPKAITPTR